MAVAADRTGELDVGPSLEEVRELAREHTLVPLRHTFIADTETPVSAYLKLRGESPDPYGAVADELARYRSAALDGPPPFTGGAVGLFGYDLVRSAEPTVGLPNPDEAGIPDLALMITDLMVAFDHLRHEVTVLANVFAEDDVERSYEQAAAAIAEVKEKLAGRVPQRGVGRQDPPEFFSNLGREGYGAAVERAIEYIHAGDAYQVVPSQRWTANCPVDAFSIYRGLRAINPSPYMYFLDFEDFQIAGASPESLVKVGADRVELRPIAGTRPRTGSDAAGLADDLLSDEKERAEHVMLVDL